MEKSTHPKIISYYSKHKLRVWCYLLLMTLNCILMCGTAFSFSSLQNVLQQKEELYNAPSWVNRIGTWTTAAGGLNCWGSAFSGLILPIVGTKMSSIPSLVIAGIGAAILTAGLRYHTESNLVGIGLLILSFGEAGTSIYTAPLAYMFSSPKFLFTYCNAVFALSSFPFMIIQVMADRGYDLYKLMIAFTTCQVIFAFLATAIWPKDIYALVDKHNVEFNPHLVPLADHMSSDSFLHRTKSLCKDIWGAIFTNWRGAYVFWVGTICEVAWQCLLAFYLGAQQDIFIAAVGTGAAENSLTTGNNLISGLLGVFISIVVVVVDNIFHIHPLKYFFATMSFMWIWIPALVKKSVASQWVALFLFYICQSMWFSALYTVIGEYYPHHLYGPLTAIWCFLAGLATIILGFGNFNIPYTAPWEGIIQAIEGICIAISIVGVCSYIFFYFDLKREDRGKKLPDHEINDGEFVEVSNN